MKLLASVLFLVGAASAIPTKTLGNVELAYVPGRGLMDAACVNSVPSGTSSRRNPDGGLIATFPDGTEHSFPACRKLDPPLNETLPADYDGWLAYTAFDLTSKGGSFDSYLGYFSVPDAPSRTPAVLYLFTGLQNINWIPKVDPEPTTDFDIIQPVLQYPGDFGAYWSVKSWYVTLNDGALASAEVEVSAGDNIFGNMTRTGPSSWDIISVSSSTLKSTTQTAKNSRLVDQPWAYNTLECYGCSGCSTFPTKPSVFTKLELTSGGSSVKPNWAITPRTPADPQCHEKASVATNGDVTISFT